MTLSYLISSRTILPPPLYGKAAITVCLFCFACFLDDIFFFFFLWIRYYAMTSGSFSNGDVFVVG